MVRAILILLLLVCGLNTIGTALIADDSFGGTTCQEVSRFSDEDQEIKILSSDQNQHRSGNSCEDESCQFHQCHLGHCSFLLSPYASSDMQAPVSARAMDLENSPASICLSIPVRPPSV